MSDKKPYQMCSQCVMDNTHQEIEFNEAGVCNFCREYQAAAKRYLLPEVERRQKLKQIIQEVKERGQGREFDCILGISGGVDSSYLAYKLKEFSVRPLLVQVDNGWNSELAARNIECICEKLHYNLMTYTLEWEEFRDLQRSFLKSSVANVEAPSDHGIFAALYQVANQRGIKYILNGNNIVTEQISVPLSYGWRYQDLRQIRGIHRRFGAIKLKTFPQMGFWKKEYYEIIKGIRMISLLNYIPYNKADAIEELQREFGWRSYGGKHHESIITRFFQCYILVNKFGMDKRKVHLSDLIHSGQISRVEALGELKNPPCDSKIARSDLEFVIKKLEITEKEFDAIMAEAPRSYRNYPNEEWLYKMHGFVVGRIAVPIRNTFFKRRNPLR